MIWTMTESALPQPSDSSGRFVHRTETQEQGLAKFKKTPLAKWLVLLVFIPFLIEAVVYLKVLLQCLVARNDTTYPEGANVYVFLTALHTGHLYSSPFDFPLNPGIYGPMFYSIGAFCALIMHGDPTLTTRLMRVLSLLSFLGSIGLIAYLTWRLERVKHWTAITVVLGLACTWARPFAASARPDAISIFLIIASLTLYVVAEGRSRLIFWAGVLGALSFLTKQTMAPMLMALAIDSLMARKFRNTVALVAGSATMAAIVIAALWLRHEPFLANYTAETHAIVKWSSAAITVTNYMRTNQMAIIPIIIAFVGARLRWREKRYRVILLAAGFGCFLNLAALANLGGAENYLILPWLMVALLVPAGLVQLEAWANRSVLIPAALMLIGVALLVHQKNLIQIKAPANLDTTNISSMTMLSDLSYLEMRSRDPQLMDPAFYHQISMQKVWSGSVILDRIGMGVYDLILIKGEDAPMDSGFAVLGYRGISTWGPDMLDAMNLHYRPLCELPGYIALVPRDPSRNQTNVPSAETIGEIFRKPCEASNRTLQLSPGSH
jgi:hypothetical protein